MEYVLTIAILLIAYVSVILLMGRIKNTRIANLVFFAGVFGCYVIYTLQVLFLSGYNSIYFHGVIATANISPFMFSIMPIIYFSRGKLRKHLFILISLLSVGMLLSPTLNALTYAVKGYPFTFYAAWDYIAHLLLSLWGIYIVRSRQVKINVRDAILSALIIIGVAIFMLLMNLIHGTSFFGLALDGNHNIYHNVIVDNSYISALIYFTGLIAVLIAGFFYSKLFYREKHN